MHSNLSGRSDDVVTWSANPVALGGGRLDASLCEERSALICDLQPIELGGRITNRTQVLGAERLAKHLMPEPEPVSIQRHQDSMEQARFARGPATEDRLPEVSSRSRTAIDRSALRHIGPSTETSRSTSSCASPLARWTSSIAVWKREVVAGPDLRVCKSGLSPPPAIPMIRSTEN